MKQYIAAMLLSCCCVQAHSQKNTQATFTPLFDFQLILSGNFGEIRSNHFHGGLDFKTQNVSGKKTMALGTGYISRIRVTHGSGYMLDVCYENGYSTINRHLSAFVSPIAERVEKLQYETESWEVDITPEVNEYPVKAWQQIAWSGNTGYSFGPHLHLDMFETGGGDFIDPLPFFKGRMTDNQAPKAEGFILFPQAGRGVVNKEASEPYPFPLANKEPIEAWGVVGAGIRAYDYMDGANNRYGVHTVILTVDGTEVFRSVVDRFSSYENRMINSWTYGQYMKSFIDPGNTLRMLQAANDNRGLVTIDQERDYLFRYELRDAYNNVSHYSFTVRGKAQPIAEMNYREKYFFRWYMTNYLKEPGLDLFIPRGLLYDDVALNYAVRADSGAIAFTYQLHDKRIYLHSSCDLQIGVRRKIVADSTKYYVARITEKGKKVSVGGKYEKGFVKTRINELGTYTVEVDTIAPKVTPIGEKNWARSGKIVYKIKEDETDIHSYRGTIDGKYALFGLDIMNNRIEYELDPRRVKRGGTHQVEVTVTDKCGNVTVVKNNFNY